MRAKKVLTSLFFSAFAASVWATLPDVQVFTSSGTWTKPAGATVTYAVAIAGGGGGASGRRGAAGTNRTGGGGGWGGGCATRILRTSLLGATETVTVGAGGAGGAKVATDNTDGNPGVAGGDSLFGEWIRALGGPGGAKGVQGTTTTAATSPGTVGTCGEPAAGGNGKHQNASDGAVNATIERGFNAGGGGGGSGIDSSNNYSWIGGNGASGSFSRGVPLAGGCGGGTACDIAPSWFGDPGTSATSGEASGGGGGGGASAVGGPNDGGSGGLYGGGGGGASANINSSPAYGNGGAGAPGIVIVVSW